MTTTTVYADIVKHERDENGDLIVFGRATGPDLDLDQQVMDPAWLKTAVPAWFQTGANVREQHSPIAAGVGTEISESADGGWDLKALVVDSNSARKVERGVLKGYSIGIRNPKVIKDVTAPGGRIVAGSIVEISLVDRPANPSCQLVMAKAAKPGMTVAPGDLDAAHMLVKVEELHEAAASDMAGNVLLKLVDNPSSGDTVEKRDFSTAQRDAAANSGAALPDGSFPIKTVADLKNAIQAIGRAKDPAKAKAHIKSRAKALGKENLIPDTWKAVDGDVEKAAADGMWVHDPQQLSAIRNGLVAVMKAELDELDDGDHELCDISDLLTSLSIFLSWWNHEAAGGETTSPYSGDNTEGGLMAINLSNTADVTKTGTAATVLPAAPAADAPAADAAAVAKSAGGTETGAPAATPAGDLGDVVKTAITEAFAPLAEQLAALKTATDAAIAKTAAAGETGVENTPSDTPSGDVAKSGDPDPKTDLTELVKAQIAEAIAPLQEQVAKAMQQPAPGGPVLARTAQDTRKADRREGDLAKAAEWERLAYEISDPVAREGYLAKAAEARKAAA